MDRVSFAQNEGPLLVDVIKEKTFAEVRAAMLNGAVSGAMGYDIHLSPLTEEVTEKEVEKLAAHTRLPIMVLDYKLTYDGKSIAITDEARTERFLTCVRCGVSCVDMQGYTFNEGDTKESFSHNEWRTERMSFIDAMPDEVTINPYTIEKQVNFIDKIHSEGGEVLLSTHVHKFMTCEQITDLVHFLDERGADVIKIVGNSDDEDQLAEVLRTVLKLKTMGAKAKLHYHSVGKCGRVTRLIAPMLGSYLMFCVDKYSPASLADMPDLRTMTDAYRTMPWRS